MPNYSSTILTIRGSKPELTKFRKFAKTSVSLHGMSEKNALDTNQFLPYPNKYLIKDIAPETKITENDNGQYRMVEGKDGYNSGGYEWCSKNWGTKWGICHAELVVKETDKKNTYDNSDYNKPQLIYEYDTAWTPGTPIVIKMSKMFPKLSFKRFVEEESRAFVFEDEIKNGKTIEYEDHDPDKFYSHEDEDE